MSASALYDLTFVVLLAVMTGGSVLVTALLRRLLRGWKSTWRKLLAIHIANGAALFALVTLITSHVRLAAYLGVINGTIFHFALGFMLADGLRAWWSARPSGEARTRERQALVIFAVVVAVTATLVRVGNPSAKGKHALEELSWAVEIGRKFRSTSPGRELMPAIRDTFPKELYPVLDRLVAQTRAEAKAANRPVLGPAFPVREVGRFIDGRWVEISRAPDDALVALARTMPGIARLTAQPEFCRVLTSPRSKERDHLLSQPASEAEMQAVALFMAAQLRAARAGIDQPVKRDFSPEHVAAVRTRLGGSAAPDNSAVAPFDVRRPEDCAQVSEILNWVGQLSDDDAAYAIAYAYAHARRPTQNLLN